MKGLFGIFNKTLFKILGPTDPVVVTKDIGNTISKSCHDIYTDIDINISNVKENVSTNREMYLHALKKIDEESIKDIDFLAPRYRISIDYQLYDNIEEVIVDEATVTKHITPQLATLPLGLDASTNELVYRVVNKFTHTVDLVYKQEIPFGIMKQRRGNLTLYINRILIEEEKAITGQLTNPDDVVKDDEVCILHHRRRPNYQTTYTFKTTYVQIYDSEAENIEFTPITIQEAPRKVAIKVTALLNNYFLTATSEDIIKPIADNYEKSLPVSGDVPIDEKKENLPEDPTEKPVEDDIKEDDSKSEDVSKEEDKKSEETTTDDPSDTSETTDSTPEENTENPVDENTEPKGE